MDLTVRSPSGPSSIASEEEPYMSPAVPQVHNSMGINSNSTQVTLAETNQPGQDSFNTQQHPHNPAPSIRHDTGLTMIATMSPSLTSPTLSPSSTMKPSMTVTSTMEKSSASKVTTAEPRSTAQQPPVRPQGMKARLTALYHEFYLQFSMVGLAFLGLFTALAHHLYNASLSGQEISGDPQWPPRYGSALSFFVRMVLVGSVQIAYKQQAWVC